MGMIRQCFYDSALPDRSSTAGSDHVLQFGFQRSEARNSCVDVVEIGFCDLGDGFAGEFGVSGEINQLAYLILGKAQFPAVLEKCQSFQMTAAVEPRIA